jgi:rhamnulokinase
MNTYHYLACDLGAESGRVMLGTLADGKITLEEIHRFPNGAVAVNGSLRWDVIRLFDELKTGLRKVAARGLKVQSLSTDSWGVDYVWLKDNEPMLTAPYQYRDVRTDGGLERAFAVVPKEEIFAETGSLFMTINTLYQLHADLQSRPWVFKSADCFLNIGDYFNFLFSGVRRAEQSLASTSQLYRPKNHKWSAKLIRGFKFNKKVFPEIVPSGTVLGDLLPAIADETGLKGVKVVASCSHDTGAAVAAVPGKGKDWAYLSSGTWSLLGVENKKPVITDKTSQYNFTNEVGYGGSIRYLTNIVGLWIIQECKRTWAKEGQNFSYDQLIALGQQATPLKSLINPMDPRFGKPNDMPKKIADYCRETGQPAPQTTGEFVRCIYESLGLLYRRTLGRLEDATGREIRVVHAVGGGSQNPLLSQITASATGRVVHAGPVEATATGNILIQAIALGHLPDLAALREVVKNSFALKTYEPQDAVTWNAACERFQKLP